MNSILQAEALMAALAIGDLYEKNGWTWPIEEPDGTEYQEFPDTDALQSMLLHLLGKLREILPEDPNAHSIEAGRLLLAFNEDRGIDAYVRVGTFKEPEN